MKTIENKKIRNFSIIAHIDHGKSTLADRLLEKSLLINSKQKLDRVLDNLGLEKKRGITIKLNPVHLVYSHNNSSYYFNLIDTPGHYDFMYEVFNSLRVCDMALLLVDATKGVQSQTIAYYQIAKKMNLFVLPVINKSDVATKEQLENTKEEIKKITFCEEKMLTFISAKTGDNVDLVIEKIINFSTHPKISEVKNSLFKASIFDIMYDKYDGAIIFIKVLQGFAEKNKKIKIFVNGEEVFYKIEQLGVKTPERKIREKLWSGEIGWIIIKMKDLSQINPGDFIWDFDFNKEICLLDFNNEKKPEPNIYCNIFPSVNDDFNNLKKSLDNLKILDNTFTTSITDSRILGSGFTCGFLGSLHCEVICQRLKEEYFCDFITTPASTPYKITFQDGKIEEYKDLQKIGFEKKIKLIEELFIGLEIIFPKIYLKIVKKICEDNFGIFIFQKIETESFCRIVYDMPYAKFVSDFAQKIKSNTKGYASFVYEFKDFRPNNLEKIDIMLNGEKIPDFSFICNYEDTYNLSHNLCLKLKTSIPKQNFPVTVQAINNKNKIISRENIASLKKNVTGNLYGGDRTRKMKLWKKQKEGKNRMKKVGNLNLNFDIISKIFS